MLLRMSSAVVGIVLVTRNRRDLLLECLSALDRQTFRDFKCYVIDNASTDDTPQVVRQFERPWIELKRLEKNIGASGGFYEGVKCCYSAGHPWIWIMDDDTIADPTALEELIKAAGFLGHEHDPIGFLSSDVRWTDGQRHVMNKTGVDPEFIEDTEALKAGFIRIKTGSFVSMLLSRNAVKSVGFPIWQFFIWLTDYEYSIRIISSGYSAFYVPQSRVVHKTEKNAGWAIENINERNMFKYQNAIRNRTYLAFHSILPKSYRKSAYSNLKREAKTLIKKRKFKVLFSIFLPSLISGFRFNPKVEVPDLHAS